jgi:hypothetical protein
MLNATVKAMYWLSANSVLMDLAWYACTFTVKNTDRLMKMRRMMYGSDSPLRPEVLLQTP